MLDFTHILQNLLLIDCQKSSYFLHLKHFLPSVCLGATKSSRAVVRDKAPWRSEKGAAELWEMPSPKHFPEETHHDPAGSVCKETERGCDAEHFPVFQGILGPSRAPSQCHCSAQLLMACRDISSEKRSNPSAWEPERGRAQGRGRRIHQRCRGDNAAQTQHHGDTNGTASAEGHCPFHFPPLVLQRRFLRQMLWFWKATRALGPLEAQLQPPYLDFQKDVAEGPEEIRNCFAAQACDWKENQNAEGS